jgi:hypothetical protein
MAGPITWRNVSGDTGVRDASNALDSASQSILGGLNRLGGVVKDQQKLQADNQANARTNSNNALLDGLSSQFKTSEDLEAAMEDGRVESLFAQLGGNVDPELKRTAVEDQLNTLYTKENQAYDRDVVGFKRAAAPKQDEFRALLAKDPEKAQSFLDDNSDIFNSANIYGALTQELSAEQRTKADQTRADRLAKRADKLITDTDAAEEILAEAVLLGAGSSDEAFGIALANATEEGLPAPVQAKMLQQVEDRWALNYGLTKSQEKEHSQFVATQNSVLEEKATAINSDYERVVRAAGIKPDSIYANMEGASLGQAAEALRDKGYDPEYNSDRISQGIREALKENPALKEAGLTEGSPVMLAIVQQAMSDRMGDAWDIGPGKDNVGVSDIADAIKNELPTYLNYLENAQALEQARSARDAELSTLRTDINSQIVAHRDYFKERRKEFNTRKPSGA